MTFQSYVVCGLVVCATGLAAASAQADREVFNVSDPAYRAECGSCHIPYPPALLPKSSWQAMLKQLDRHFGSDASVDGATLAKIEAYLLANAGRSRDSGASVPLRITETRWFRREHDEVPARVWKDPAVKSPSNCGACHTRAEQGDFSERTLRVPR